MGSHKKGMVSIGAFVDIRLREYLDKIVSDCKLLSRSAALRAIIVEHRSLFYTRKGRNLALKPLDGKSNDYTGGK
jgi:hypothetical protein